MIDKTHYIVTKYEAGQDLCNYSEAQGQDKLPELQVLKIFTQIALGLKDIHSQRIVHRDIKHKNILLSDSSKQPKVKITDFGLASYL